MAAFPGRRRHRGQSRPLRRLGRLVRRRADVVFYEISALGLALLVEGDIHTDQLRVVEEALHQSCSDQVLRSCCSKVLEERIDHRNCLFATATTAD